MSSKSTDIPRDVYDHEEIAECVDLGIQVIREVSMTSNEAKRRIATCDVFETTRMTINDQIGEKLDPGREVWSQ